MSDPLSHDASEVGRGGPSGSSRPSSPWIRSVPSPEERAAELAATERQATRDRRRDLAVAAAEGTASLVVGLYLVGWSLHTTDEGWGAIALLAGVALGNAGLMLTLVRAHGRAVERGDL